MVMSRSSSRAGLTRAVAAVFIGLLGLVLPHTASAAAPTATWDQARVTAIAAKLAKSADELYDQEYKAPNSFDMGSGGAHSDFMDRLRRLKHETRHLASSLEKGASAKSTRGSVEQIKELNDDLAEYGRKISFENPVLNQTAAFEDLVRQLMPYYGLEESRH
jgi:hypothetical protein